MAARRMREAGLNVRMMAGHDADDAGRLAAECVAEGVDTLVVAGGDGMVHLAAQALCGSTTRLGIIPTGTGNDVARTLGVDPTDALGAVDIVIGGRERTIDLARAGGRCFVSVLSAGFDAVVTERANRMHWPRGQARYSLATVAELRTFRPIPYVLELDGEQSRFEAMLVVVANGPSYGGGLRIAEGAQLDDGFLDVVVILPMPRRELLATYPKLFKGTHVNHRAYRHHRVRRVSVAAPGVVAHADGERIAPLPLTVDVVPQALRVLVP